MIAAEAAELLRGQVAAVDLHLDGREALLALRLDVAFDEALELAAVAVRRGGSGGLGGGVGLLVVVEAEALDQLGVELALLDPVALELLVDQLAEGVHADLVDQDLDPGAGAVDAQPLLAVEDAQHGLGDLEVVAVVGLDELVEGRARRGP